MKAETLNEVRHLICDFLDDYLDDGWAEEDLYDLDTDIVTAVLKYEFPEDESSDDLTFLFDEEELITDVENAVGKVTEQIEERWSDDRIMQAARDASEVAIAKVKEVFKL